jgi:hypothetical protein
VSSKKTYDDKILLLRLIDEKSVQQQHNHNTRVNWVKIGVVNGIFLLLLTMGSSCSLHQRHLQYEQSIREQRLRRRRQTNQAQRSRSKWVRHLFVTIDVIYDIFPGRATRFSKSFTPQVIFVGIFLSLFFSFSG